jgi:hypothetical protein
MPQVIFYRGGPSLEPDRGHVKLDKKTGLILPKRGVSVCTVPEDLEKFGGAYRLGSIPEELDVIQQGPRPEHYEIIPARPMTFERYKELLGRIPLTPV